MASAPSELPILNPNQAEFAIKLIFQTFGGVDWSGLTANSRRLSWLIDDHRRQHRNGLSQRLQSVGIEHVIKVNNKKETLSIHVPQDTKVREITYNALRPAIVKQPAFCASQVHLANHIVLTLRPYMSGDDLEIRDPVLLAQVILDRAKEDLAI